MSAREHRPDELAAAFDQHLHARLRVRRPTRERLVEIDAAAVGRGIDDLDLGAGRGPRVDAPTTARAGS